MRAAPTASGVNALAVLITTNKSSVAERADGRIIAASLRRDRAHATCFVWKLVQTYVIYCGIVDPVPGGPLLPLVGLDGTIGGSGPEMSSSDSSVWPPVIAGAPPIMPIDLDGISGGATLLLAMGGHTSCSLSCQFVARGR